jgi:hypothetical protein
MSILKEALFYAVVRFLFPWIESWKKLAGVETLGLIRK